MKFLIHYTNHLTIYAIVLLAIGLLLRCIVGIRRFTCRGIAGLQHFKSYGVALVTSLIGTGGAYHSHLDDYGAIFLYLIK